MMADDPRSTALRCVARAQILVRDLYRTAAAEDLRKARAGLGLELDHIALALSEPLSDEQAQSAPEHPALDMASANAAWLILERLTYREAGATSDRVLCDLFGGDKILTAAARGALVDGGLLEPVIPVNSTPRTRLWRVTERGRALAKAMRALPDLTG